MATMPVTMTPAMKETGLAHCGFLGEQDKRAERQDRRHPDADVDAVESTFDVVTGLEVDRHAEQVAGEGGEEEGSPENAFRIRVGRLPPLRLSGAPPDETGREREATGWVTRERSDRLRRRIVPGCRR